MTFDRMQAANIVARESATIMSHVRTIQPFKIGTVTYGADYLVPLLQIDPAQLDVQHAQIAGWIGFWGIKTAEAKKAHDNFQVRYRMQRDGFITAAQKAGEDGADEKPKKKAPSKTAAEAEWRTKPEYEQLYTDIADLEYAWSCAQFVYEALLRKSLMLQSLGKLYADERATPQPAGVPAASR